jgi:hypothetical protein
VERPLLESFVPGFVEVQREPGETSLSIATHGPAAERATQYRRITEC